jgi:hypothetical protein
VPAGAVMIPVTMLHGRAVMIVVVAHSGSPEFLVVVPFFHFLSMLFMEVPVMMNHTAGMMIGIMAVIVSIVVTSERNSAQRQ